MNNILVKLVLEQRRVGKNKIKKYSYRVLDLRASGVTSLVRCISHSPSTFYGEVDTSFKKKLDCGVDGLHTRAASTFDDFKNISWCLKKTLDVFRLVLLK